MKISLSKMEKILIILLLLFSVACKTSRRKQVKNIFENDLIASKYDSIGDYFGLVDQVNEILKHYNGSKSGKLSIDMSSLSPELEEYRPTLAGLVDGSTSSGKERLYGFIVNGGGVRKYTGIGKDEAIATAYLKEVIEELRGSVAVQKQWDATPSKAALILENLESFNLRGSWDLNDIVEMQRILATKKNSENKLKLIEKYFSDKMFKGTLKKKNIAGFKVIEEKFSMQVALNEAKKFQPEDILKVGGFTVLEPDEAFNKIDPNLREQILSYVEAMDDTKKINLYLQLYDKRTKRLRDVDATELLKIMIGDKDIFGPFITKKVQQENTRLGQLQSKPGSEVMEIFAASESRKLPKHIKERYLTEAKALFPDLNIQKVIAAGSLGIVFELPNNQTLKWVPDDIVDSLVSDKNLLNATVEKWELRTLESIMEEFTLTKIQAGHYRSRKIKEYKNLVAEIQGFIDECDLVDEADKSQKMAGTFDGYGAKGYNQSSMGKAKISMVEAYSLDQKSVNIDPAAVKKRLGLDSSVSDTHPAVVKEIKRLKKMFNIQGNATFVGAVDGSGKEIRGRTLKDWNLDPDLSAWKKRQIQNSMVAWMDKHLSVMLSGGPGHGDAHAGNLYIVLNEEVGKTSSKFAADVRMIDGGTIFELSPLQRSSLANLFSPRMRVLIDTYGDDIVSLTKGGSTVKPKAEVLHADRLIKYFMHGLVKDGTSSAIGAFDADDYEGFLNVFRDSTLENPRLLSSDQVLRNLNIDDSVTEALKAVSTAKNVVLQANKAADAVDWAAADEALVEINKLTPGRMLAYFGTVVDYNKAYESKFGTKHVPAHEYYRDGMVLKAGTYNADSSLVEDLDEVDRKKLFTDFSTKVEEFEDVRSRLQADLKDLEIEKRKVSELIEVSIKAKSEVATKLEELTALQKKLGGQDVITRALQAEEQLAEKTKALKDLEIEFGKQKDALLEKQSIINELLNSIKGKSGYEAKIKDLNERLEIATEKVSGSAKLSKQLKMEQLKASKLDTLVKQLQSDIDGGTGYKATIDKLNTQAELDRVELERLTNQGLADAETIEKQKRLITEMSVKLDKVTELNYPEQIRVLKESLEVEKLGRTEDALKAKEEIERLTKLNSDLGIENEKLGKIIKSGGDDKLKISELSGQLSTMTDNYNSLLKKLAIGSPEFVEVSSALEEIDRMQKIASGSSGDALKISQLQAEIKKVQAASGFRDAVRRVQLLNVLEREKNSS